MKFYTSLLYTFIFLLKLHVDIHPLYKIRIKNDIIEIDLEHVMRA